MLREILWGDMDRKGMHPQQVRTSRVISLSETSLADELSRLVPPAFREPITLKAPIIEEKAV